jgi:hypothetical protein
LVKAVIPDGTASIKYSQLAEFSNSDTVGVVAAAALPRVANAEMIAAEQVAFVSKRHFMVASIFYDDAFHEDLRCEIETRRGRFVRTRVRTVLTTIDCHIQAAHTLDSTARAVAACINSLLPLIQHIVKKDKSSLNEKLIKSQCINERLSPSRQ